jgi:hypothetical protein
MPVGSFYTIQSKINYVKLLTSVPTRGKVLMVNGIRGVEWNGAL